VAGAAGGRLAARRLAVMAAAAEDFQPAMEHPRQNGLRVWFRARDGRRQRRLV